MSFKTAREIALNHAHKASEFSSNPDTWWTSAGTSILAFEELYREGVLERKDAPWGTGGMYRYRIKPDSKEK